MNQEKLPEKCSGLYIYIHLNLKLVMNWSELICDSETLKRLGIDGP